MKIRNGFVSNSSSSSFLICGYYLGESGTEKVLKVVDAWKKRYPNVWQEILRNNGYDEVNPEESASLIAKYCDCSKYRNILPFYVLGDSDYAVVYLGRCLGSDYANTLDKLNEDANDVDKTITHILEECGLTKEMFAKDVDSIMIYTDEYADY